MQSVSTRWVNAIKESGKRITKVDVYNRWSVGAGEMVAVGTLLKEDADCEFVSVTEDSGALIRRTASITTTDTTIISMIQELSPNPLGVEFEISMGVEYPDGTSELLPKGIFMVDQVDYPDGGAVMELGLVDRSRRLTFFKDERPIVYDTPGTPVDTIVDAIMVDPDYANWATGAIDTSDFDGVTTLQPLSTTFRDPLTFINELLSVSFADSAEVKIYFDADGRAIAAAPTVIGPDPFVVDHAFTKGAGGDLISANVTIQMNGFANNIQVGPTLNESTGLYEFQFVTVPDSDDVTYALGPAGYRTKIFDATPDQISVMDDLALAYYWQNWGLNRRVQIEAVGNPALEADDIVSVELSTGEEVSQVITSVTHDSNGGMQISTKGQGFS